MAVGVTFRTRFAPSPTGPLHLGHAFSAILAHDMAMEAGGEFLLRIDDLDQTRSRPEWENLIFKDLTWLGLTWPMPVRHENDHAADYAAALARLGGMGLTYPCRCRRKDIEAAANAPQEGVPQFGPDGRIYPGTCRGRPMSDRQADDVIRLNMEKSLAAVGAASFTETGPLHFGEHQTSGNMINAIGDVILSRRDMAAAYHLAVVVDDAAQAVTHVIRGSDLFEATFIHALLQKLLGLSTPIYHHHDLIRDDAGKRLAKRDDARAIRTYREDGFSPSDVRKLVGL